jgi:hypothetical protein
MPLDTTDFTLEEENEEHGLSSGKSQEPRDSGINLID